MEETSNGKESKHNGSLLSLSRLIIPGQATGGRSDFAVAISGHLHSSLQALKLAADLVII